MGSCSTDNLLAVFTVSPKRQYLGILLPTTPDTTGPVWIPILGSPETVFVVRDRYTCEGGCMSIVHCLRHKYSKITYLKSNFSKGLQ